MHNMLLGGYRNNINLQDASIEDYGFVGVVNADARFQIHNDGTVKYYGSGGGWVTQYNWVTPTSLGPDYWMRATKISGDAELTTGFTLNTWTDTNLSPQFGISRNFTGFESLTLLIEISSDSGGSVVLKSATITLYVQMDN